MPIGTGKLATGNAGADLSSQYLTSAWIKIIATAIHSNAGEGNTNFTLDTKAPTNVGCSSPSDDAIPNPERGNKGVSCIIMGFMEANAR